MTFAFPSGYYNYGSYDTMGRGAFSGTVLLDAISTVPTQPDSLYDWFDATISSTGGRGVKAIGFCAAFRTDQTVAAGQVLFTLSDATTGTIALPALGGAGNPEYVFIGYQAPAGKTITRVQAARTAAAGGGYVSVDDLSFVMQPSVTLSVNPTSIAENGATATVTATLSNTTSDTVTVNLGYTAGTATLGTDFTAPNSITINAGSLTGTATITATQDASNEGEETVKVDITSVTNGVESGTQQVTTTIIDDDATIIFANNTLTYGSPTDLGTTIDPTGLNEAPTYYYGMTKAAFQALNPKVVAFNGAPVATQNLRTLVAYYTITDTVTFDFSGHVQLRHS